MALGDDIGNFAGGGLQGGAYGGEAGAKLGTLLGGPAGTAIGGGIGAGVGLLAGGVSQLFAGRKAERLRKQLQKREDEQHAMDMRLGNQKLELGNIEKSMGMRKDSEEGRKARNAQMIREMFSKRMTELFRGRGAQSTMGYA